MSRTIPAKPAFAALGLILAIALAVVSARPLAAAPARAKAPAAERRPEYDVYFDTTVQDDYQWLENWGDPTTRAWVEAQNARTREVLDFIPGRLPIRDRVATLTRSLSPRYFGLVQRGGTIFALKDQPPKNQPMLVVLGSLDNLATERVLVDPNAIDASGGTTIDFFKPSLDGRRVAVSLSKGGSESGEVHLYEAASGREFPDVLPRVNGGTAGGDVAWTADESGLWYTRYPAPGERAAEEQYFYQQVWFHRVGAPADSDTYVMGKDLPKIAEIFFEQSEDGRYLLIGVRNGDGGEIGWWLRDADGRIEPLAGFQDRIVDAEFGEQDLFLVSRSGNLNGQVVRVPLDWPSLSNARTLVPPGATAIEEIHMSGELLCVKDVVGGPNELRLFRLDGRELDKPTLPPMVSISGFVHLSGNDFAVEVESYTEPSRWMRWNKSSGSFVPTALVMRSPANFSGIEVRREFAVSKDGTKVPISILAKKGAVLDGRSPMLLYGYGGYGISMGPDFDATRMLWLEQGGLYAVANIRGGREYGDAWHEAGKLTRKQNVFDDFAACAQALVDRKYTSPDRLVIQGGSNGGLLMGAVMTQHPSLFRAVVSEVGVYDMLRVELTPNGLFNTTEYGTVKDTTQFKALHAYSPYHHVQDGTTYPATLLMTGVNDPRVTPGNSFKFAARLQASGTPRPVLLRTSMTTGHIGTPLNARNEEYADIYSFVFSQLGLTYRPLPAPAP